MIPIDDGRPVGDRLERVARVRRQPRDDAGRVERLRGDDHVPRESLVLAAVQPVSHANDVALGCDLERFGAQADAPGYAALPARRSASRSRRGRCRRAPSRAPHEGEVARAVAERDLVELGRRARHGRPEERRGVGRERPQPVRERPVVSVREHAAPDVGRLVPGSRARRLLVARDRPLEAQAGAYEGQPLAEGASGSRNG